MAQTGYTPILLYSSTTAAQAPAAGNLTNSTFGSELAINITDGKLFYKDNANAVQVIGWKTVPTTAGGTGLTTYTAGDLSYYATGTTFTKLAIGTTGQILTSTGSAPQWSTLSGVAVTTFSAGTTGFTPNSATSGAITLAGTLITSNGGTGLSSYTAGDLSYYASGTTLTKLAIGASGRFLSSTGSAPQWSAPAALTEVDDTNVTMTLGGTPSTALLSSVSMTLGWTGQLAVGRGGTGTGTAFTAGSVIFAGASGVYSQKNANLFWDNTNNRLGIGTTTPATILQLAASVPSLRITASGGADCEILSDGSNVYLGPIGAHNLRLQANGQTRAVVFSSGGVSIGNTTDPGATNLSVTGNVVIATSGKGIDFSANSHAGGMTSELLDWYEEGTWTPFLADSSLNASEGQTYNIQLGFYTRIGNYVYASCRITMTSIGTLTTAQRANIGGLPFTSANTTGNISAGCVSSVDGMSLGGAFMPFVRVDPNTAYMPLSKLSGTTGGSILTVGQFTATGEINVSIGYFV
jgi:hypothetical protein